MKQLSRLVYKWQSLIRFAYKTGLHWQSQWPHLNMVAVLLEAFQLRWKPGCPVRSVTNVQGNDSHLRVCHKDGKLPGCDHCNAIYCNILFGHLGTIVGLVFFVFFICAGGDWNVDGKSDDGNTHRVSGNKVLVPPGVVEDEGKHAVDKHLQCSYVMWIWFSTMRSKSTQFGGKASKASL